jgi:hypothetical protein
MTETSFANHHSGASRRQVIRGVTVVIGVTGAVAAGLTPRAAAAGAKLPPDQVHYQATPKGDARCELCANWQAPNACKVVAGAISPSGWCSLFAKKS